MRVDYEKLHKDIIQKADRENKRQGQAAKEIGVSLSTFQKMNNYPNLRMETFLKIIKWLEKDVSHYVTNKK